MSQKEDKKITTADKTIRAISESYINSQKSIVNQLTFETPNHHLTTGTTREKVWLNLFESMIPKKFCIDQGVFIIDSYGKISAEVDFAIFDEQYTPYIFKFENMKFVPIEAVAVAVQCKSKTVKGVEAWADSIKKLKTSYNSYFRVISGVIDSQKNFRNIFEYHLSSEEEKKKSKLRPPYSQSQTSTRPLLILCTSVKEAKITKTVEQAFDIILSVDQEERLKKTIFNMEKDYSWWYEQLNHYGHKRYPKEQRIVLEKLIPDGGKGAVTGKTLKELVINTKDENQENVLLSLTFQLNQLLMLINNPMPFPHQSYAEMFKQNYQKFANPSHSQDDEVKGES